MSATDREAFARILADDVRLAWERASKSGQDADRRDVIRTISAAIEGLHWQLKDELLKRSWFQLSIHEQAAMREEAFSVSAIGEVNVQPRFLPLTTAIRLVVQVIKRIRPSYELDFGCPSWASLRSTVEVRNRLVHPKSLQDLGISQDEVDRAMTAFRWMDALVPELLGEANAYVTELRRAGFLVPIEDE